MTVGVGESGSVVMRVGGAELAIWSDYCVDSNFLVPTDGFRFVVSDEQITGDLFELLIPGAPLELVINGHLQVSGFIDIVEAGADRSSGRTITVEGRDTMGPVVDAEIDTRKHFPDKTTLEKLLADTLEPFGFDTFFIDNEQNSNVQAGKALPRHKKSRKKLGQYPIPKSKPHHNETHFQFLSRIVQREGLWIWPMVEGNGVVVAKPDYDQGPRYHLRRTIGGSGNNILHGGIRRDATGQPSYLVATGNVPATEFEHHKLSVVIDHPYLGSPTRFLLSGRLQGGFQNEQDKIPEPQRNLIKGTAAFTSSRSSGALRNETGTFSDVAAGVHIQDFKWTTKIPAAPAKIANPFASSLAKPIYRKDTESHTQAQLQNFARREMSLYVRRAFAAHYTILGHEIDGVPVTVDSVVQVDDESCNFHGPLWVLSRTMRKSRSAGTTTDLELVPLHALEF